MKNVFSIALLALVVIGFASCEKEESTEVKIDFQSLNLQPNSFWNGSDASGGYKFDIATFSNSFTDWGGGFTSWSGFAFSNVTDTATSGYDNQYSAMVTSLQNPLNVYAVAYYSSYSQDDTKIEFDRKVNLVSVNITNTVYAHHSMRNGNQFSKKFGGVDGTDPDWFLLTIDGYNNGVKTQSLDFYLADFRSANSSQDYIRDSWTNVNLSSLGSVDKIMFKFTSTDNGGDGMNTPAYVAIDDLVYE
jgi:hypothetical protein